jgi:hypothetical protein
MTLLEAVKMYVERKRAEGLLYAKKAREISYR